MVKVDPWLSMGMVNASCRKYEYSRYRTVPTTLGNAYNPDWGYAYAIRIMIIMKVRTEKYVFNI